jgi:hypothetical protein
MLETLRMGIGSRELETLQAALDAVLPGMIPACRRGVEGLNGDGTRG